MYYLITSEAIGIGFISTVVHEETKVQTAYITYPEDQRVHLLTKFQG